MSNKPKTLAVWLGVLLTALGGAARAEYALNLPEPVTEIAGDILELHNLILGICFVIFLIVFGVMFYAVFKHRKSRGAEAAKFHHNTKLEVVWTLIPFLILVSMAIPSTATLIKMEKTADAEMTVKITGYQWKWRYEYMDHDVDFFSNLSSTQDQIYNKEEKSENYLIEVDNHLVLPVGKKVRFLLTANDVIHAWWVPQLGVKKDAIPGFINEMWTQIDEPGTYRGQCAELCGKDHGFMPIVVDAVPQEEFDAWVSEQEAIQVAAAASADREWTMDELMERGEEVYKQCSACHGVEGQGVPNVFPPMAGSPVATGPVDAHIDIILLGKEGTAMQAFGAQFNDADIAAVTTYERNAFGNNTGDLVQPAQVKARR